MNYPQIKFRLNKNLDFKVAKGFLNQSKGGIDFGKDGILKPHPGLKKINLGSDKNINKYINNFYRKNKDILKENLIDFEKRWEKIEKDFFHLCDQLFDNLPWPKGKYISYISIFDCGPRFLEDKTFQVFYRAGKESNFCTIHEMLHFQFYNYLDKRLKQYKQIDSDKIWELSEIFNSLIMWQDEKWKKICDPVKPFINYPDYGEAIKKLKPIWNKNKSIQLLFDQYLKYSL